MSDSTQRDSFDLRQAITGSRWTALWRVMAGYHWAYAGATAALALAALAKTANYLLLGYFVDQVIGHGADWRLPAVAAGFVVLAATEGTFSFLSGRQTAYTAEGVARRLRDFLFDHIQRLSFAYHSQTPTGELIERVTSDVDALRRFYSEQAIGVGRIVLLFLINFGALLILSWQLALLSVVVVPLVLLTSVVFFRRVNLAYEAYQEQEAILSTTLQENLSGVRVVKAFARQDYEREKFRKVNWEKYLRGRRLLTLHAQFWPLSDLLCGAQLLCGFLVAAYMAMTGSITVGTYLAYAGLVIWLIWPMRMLGRLIVQTSTGLVSFERVMTLIRQAREPLDEPGFEPPAQLSGDILFEAVSFGYDAQAPILRDITFHCKPGQVIALLGATGSGKTSLVNLLPRFYDRTAGRLELDGRDLRDYSRRFLREHIGIVEQEPFLFSRSIRENIAFGATHPVSQDEIEAAARAAAIHDSILSFPQGYDTIVGEKGVTLSGGQKQRVAIARTLLKNPRILIMDDSTSAVDTETEAEIRSALQELTRTRPAPGASVARRTTFVIAHRIQSVMQADLILVLDKGRIVQRGTHAELLGQSGPYRRIYDIQTRIEAELERDLAQTGPAVPSELELVED
jgi:ATP-binding cassette subfamily B protein